MFTRLITIPCFSILLLIAWGTTASASEKDPISKPISTNRLEEPTLSFPLKNDRKSFPFTGNDSSVLGSGGPLTGKSGPQVSREVRRDVSLPLSWMPILPAPAPKIALERVNRRLPRKPSNPNTKDPVVQESPFSSDISVTPNIPSLNQNFEGNFATGYIPPDTNGDVGPNHYVQTVNVSYAIFNKSGGVLRNPDSITTIFSGLSPCNEEYGDPIVLYDQLADRWFISQFAIPASNYQCIAVSQTSDPLGAYNRYVYLWSHTLINDYPKFGVWPNGYYMSVNEFTCGLSSCTFEGAGAAAFARHRMLQGLSAPMVAFHQQPDGGQLPSDLDGSTPPPLGAPNYFLSFDLGVNFYVLHLWEFDVDWTNPQNSTFTQQPSLNVAPFSLANSVPQPAGPPLDAISDRLMHRLAYRNFGTHESLVVNHTVNASGVAGVRWYEVRNPGGSPFVHQQGTYAPSGGVHRWMASMAMDASGNIAVGYSASGSSLKPSIRYSGRLASDPPGTLPQGEGTIRDGGGSQDFFERWGDYSSLSIDPTDDCTFWYTNEYYPFDSFFEWQTRIASFKFPDCGSGCNPPFNLSNNTATDENSCSSDGIVITWPQDPGNWNDSGGTRTYDVLRDGNVIASALAYGTTTYTDIPGDSTTHTYVVRYNNGCGSSATTAGVTVADVSSLPPSNLSNNTATDKNSCALDGIVISWVQDPGNWNDSGGTRTYDVLRDGNVIASALAYGTTTYTDIPGDSATHIYAVRYTNGCGSIATTSGASAADNNNVQPVTETANQGGPITAKNTIKTAALSPPFTISAGLANSANISWSLTGFSTPYLTNCAIIRLRAPDGTETTLKAAATPDPGSASVLNFYNAEGPGTYSIVLEERTQCGTNKQSARVASTQMIVASGSCN